MEINRIINYFNPITNFNSANKFKRLSSMQKIETLVATAFAAIITLPFGGLGGVATFRVLTNKFVREDYNPLLDSNLSFDHFVFQNSRLDKYYSDLEE